MDNLSDSYRQPRTIQLSPDSLVFINGSNILETPEGEPFDIRQDITTVTTSLNIDSVPGTANFTISYPEHRQGKKKYQNLKIMSEVVIYFRGRFQKQKKDNKGAVVTGEYFYPYYQSFWGVIVAITESYSDGVHTLQVSCADILRWWEITNITVNPSLMASAEGLKNYLNKLGLNEKDTKMFIDGLSTVDKNGKIYKCSVSEN